MVALSLKLTQEIEKRDPALFALHAARGRGHATLVPGGIPGNAEGSIGISCKNERRPSRPTQRCCTILRTMDR
jgi:hypothetical protein